MDKNEWEFFDRIENLEGSTEGLTTSQKDTMQLAKIANIVLFAEAAQDEPHNASQIKKMHIELMRRAEISKEIIDEMDSKFEEVMDNLGI